MNSFYKTINGTQTLLLTWDDPFDCNGRDVLVIISGNPGIPEFYIDFATELHKKLQLPICVVGHAGHSHVPDLRSNELKAQEHLFNLEGQLKHKLELLCDYIDKGSRVHLIGHSIGAWLILEAIDRNDELKNRAASVNLLFPTVKNMALTKNGKFLNNIIRKIHILILLLVNLLNLLPESLASFLLSVYAKFSSLDRNFCQILLRNRNPDIWEKVLFMAYDEMDNVKELNQNGVEKIKNVCNVICGATDGWLPIHYLKEIIEFQPELQLEIVDVEHAFVLKSSKFVAERVSQFILKKISFES